MPELSPVPPKALQSLPAIADKEDRTKLRSACRQFEGYLLGELMKTMTDAEPLRPGLLGVSRGERIFRRQQSEVLGEALARRQPLGLAQMLEEALARQMETARRCE